MTNTFSKDGKPLEIERKYLIDYPDMEWLKSIPGVQTVNITQHYFDTETDSKLRVRRWEEADAVTYFFTRKKRISDMVRTEEEWEISEKEYSTYLTIPAKNRRKIGKIRYRFPYNGKTVEVDVFPFWDDKALAEVELESEDEEVLLPEQLHVIREVTQDRSYTNYSMAQPE